MTRELVRTPIGAVRVLAPDGVLGNHKLFVRQGLPFVRVDLAPEERLPGIVERHPNARGAVAQPRLVSDHPGARPVAWRGSRSRRPNP
jgi:hypothetical protein